MIVTPDLVAVAVGPSAVAVPTIAKVDPVWVTVPTAVLVTLLGNVLVRDTVCAIVAVIVELAVVVTMLVDTVVDVLVRVLPCSMMSIQSARFRPEDNRTYLPPCLSGCL